MTLSPNQKGQRPSATLLKLFHSLHSTLPSHSFHNIVHSITLLQFGLPPPLFFKTMVETREQNKSTHPGQLVVPRPHRTREQAAADCAAKATALQQKEDERMDSISGLASLEQHIVAESQQAMTQAARPPSSQVRKIACTYSVHNLQTMENENLPGMRRWIVAGESLLIHWTFAVATVVDQMGSVPMDHGGSKWKKMTAPKPKL